VSGESFVTTLLFVSRYTLLSAAGDHLVVACEIAHGTHRLDAQNAQRLMVGHVQFAVEWRHGHEVLVRSVSRTTDTHVLSSNDYRTDSSDRPNFAETTSKFSFGPVLVSANRVSAKLRLRP